MKMAKQQSDSSRWLSYLYMNPNLKIHPATDSQNPLNILEQYRIALTRMHLSEHHLRIEKGRWSRMPREKGIFHRRTDIQTEEHVLLKAHFEIKWTLMYKHYKISLAIFKWTNHRLLNTAIWLWTYTGYYHNM